MDFKHQHYSTVLPNFRSLIVFADKYGSLRILNAFNEIYEPINGDYILRNLHKYKIIIPVTRNDKVFALKLLAKLHTTMNCCNTTYLIQATNQKYYVHSLTRLAKHVVDTCYRCQSYRLIQNKGYVSNPLFTFPKVHRLNLHAEVLSQQINSTWEFDLILGYALKIQTIPLCKTLTTSNNME